MSVLTCSLKKDGDRKLAPHFLGREFACHDGSDAFKVDEELLNVLEKIRNWQQAAVIIHSAYRNPAYNKMIGGSSNSQHLYGMAADLHVVNVPHLKVAQFAESINTGGIGLYSWGVHVDTRTVKSRWQEVNNKLLSITTFGGQPAQIPAAASTITVEQKTIYVNDAAKTVRAGLVDNENYVHLRDVASALNAAVGYDADSKRISLTK